MEIKNIAAFSAVSWRDAPALEIPMTLANTTGGVIEFIVRENEEQLAHFSLAPNQTKQLNLTFDSKIGLQRELFIETIGQSEKYGIGTSRVNIDLSRSAQVNLACREQWVFPGQSMWPPVSDFLVVQVYCRD